MNDDVMRLLDEWERALEPLRSMLAADGYLLHLEATSVSNDALTLTVAAGPDACEECLVPPDVFAAVVNSHLSGRGLHPRINVVYPGAHR